MDIMHILFGSWTGILSVFTVAFAVGMLVFIGVRVARLSRPHHH